MHIQNQNQQKDFGFGFDLDGGLRDLVKTSHFTSNSRDREIYRGTKKSDYSFLGKRIPEGGVGLQLTWGLPLHTFNVIVIPQV